MPSKIQTKWTSKFKVLAMMTSIALLPIMAGCAPTTTNACCAVLKPIYAAQKDTKGTKKQVLSNNLKRYFICR